MRLLVLQFREDITEEHEQQCISQHLSDFMEAKYISIFDKSLPFEKPDRLLQGYNKLIMGGSAGLSAGPNHPTNDYDKIDYIFKTIAPLMEYVLKYDFPSFGTCFGHQILGYFLGSKILHDKNMAEVGFGEINLTEDGKKDPLFKGVPDTFKAVVGHQDSLDKIPEGAVHLAFSDRCPTQSFRYGKHVYGSQFHGELNTDDLFYRLNLFPEYQAFATNLDPQNTDHAVKLLENFLKMEV